MTHPTDLGRLRVLPVVVLATFASGIMVACSAPTPAASTSATDPTKEKPMFGIFGSSGGGSQAKQMIKDGALVIDVRSQEEWNEGHLPMAKLLPVDQLPARLADVEAWTGGDKQRPIVVHCRSGARSGRAQTILQKAGYTHVVNGGGYTSLR